MTKVVINAGGKVIKAQPFSGGRKANIKFSEMTRTLEPQGVSSSSWVKPPGA